MDATRRGMMGLAASAAAPGLTTVAFAASAPVLAEHPMIARLWHGRTTADKADEYRQYLFEAGVKKIAAPPGNRGVQMMVAKTLDEAISPSSLIGTRSRRLKPMQGKTTPKCMISRATRNSLLIASPLIRHLSLDVNLWQS